MNKMRQTSLEAYQSIVDSLGPKQKAVYEALEKNAQGLTDHELSVILSWEINRVTPRRGELVTMGYVFRADIKMVNDRRANVWKITPQSKQATFL